MGCVTNELSLFAGEWHADPEPTFEFCYLRKGVQAPLSKRQAQRDSIRQGQRCGDAAARHDMDQYATPQRI
jgi:hypothetical protein